MSSVPKGEPGGKPEPQQYVLKLLLWARAMMTTQLLHPDGSICQLVCTDHAREVIEFWTLPLPRPAQIVIAGDTVARCEAIQTCWEELGRPAHITAVRCDVPGEGLWGSINRCALARRGADKFQAVCCFDGLGQFFSSPEAAREFASTAAAEISPGGYLMGLAADSAEIWSKAVNDRREFINKEVKRALLHFTLSSSSQEFGYFGTELQMWLRGEELQWSESLAHFPAMIDTCARCRLEVLEIINLQTLFETHRKHHSSMMMLALLKPSSTKLSAQQAELLAMFTTFVFRKTEDDR